jgi:iron complex outermembrane receptor protein
MKAATVRNKLLVGMMLSSAGFAGSQTALAAVQEKLVVEEVIVTARKREESLQKVPVSVTAIQQQLQNATIRDLKDIGGISPNVHIDSVMGVPSGSTISIRGVSYQETDKSLDPAVGVLIDGVYIGVSSGQIIDNFDLERIEVLRGPQGTLFGKNTIGGALNIIKSKPTLENGAKLSYTAGRWGREDIKLIGNVGDGEKYGAKISIADLQSDGAYKNTTLDKRVGGQDYNQWGISLLAKPTDELDIQFSYDNSVDESDVGAWANFNTDDHLICSLAGIVYPWSREDACGSLDTGSGEDRTSTNDRNYNDTDVDAYNLTVNYDLGSLLLTSITGYRTSDELTQMEWDASSVNWLTANFDQSYEQLSQELRLTSQFDGDLQFVAGLYYWDSEYEQTWETHYLHYWLDIIGALDPVNGSSFGLNPASTSNSNQYQDSKSYAAFISADWQFAENWTLNLGGRYTYEEKDFAGSASQIRFNPTDDLAPWAYTRGSDDWTEFSPKIGVSYQYADDIMLFAQYAEGFKSGGYFGRSPEFLDPLDSYDPETVDTFELGMKSEWMENRLRFNATAFYSEYDDKQEEVIVDCESRGCTVVLNASTVEMQGIELELETLLTEQWSVRASYGYLDAEYDKFLADIDNDLVVTDNSYLELRNAPENTVGLSTTYEIAIGDGLLASNLSYKWMDDIETILNNQESGHQDDHEKLDASITYSRANYRISAFGRNLTDEITKRVVDIPIVSSFGQYSEGRNYGVEFVVEF